MLVYVRIFSFFLKKEPKTFYGAVANRLCANRVAYATQVDFLGILTGASKICDLLLKAKPFCYQNLYVQCSKAQFLFVFRTKTFVLGVAEFQHAICAESVGIAHTIRLYIKNFLKFFGAWGGFSKKPHIFS